MEFTIVDELSFKLPEVLIPKIKLYLSSRTAEMMRTVSPEDLAKYETRRPVDDTESIRHYYRYKRNYDLEFEQLSRNQNQNEKKASNVNCNPNNYT